MLSPVHGAFGQETDNEAKYERGNGFEQRMLGRFRTGLLARIEPLEPARVLDAGGGEGHVSAWIAADCPAARITGVDGREDAIEAYRARNPAAEGLVGDLGALPFDDDSFDLVVCTEVLEHLPEPRTVLAELARVGSRHVVLTVPHEPFFRGGNALRGRYLRRLGSTPGHLSTWGRRGFVDVVSSALEPEEWFSLFPWQGVVAKAS